MDHQQIATRNECRQVLVPITGRDRIEELLLYLEDIAQPDMKIVFLVHFGTNRFTELAGQLLEIQSGMPSNFSTDMSAPLSNLTQRIERASRGLCNCGAQIELKFYSGRLRRILRQCIAADASHPVIMRPATNRAHRWFQSLFAALRFAKPSPVMPVLLCHLGNSARRSL